MLKQGLYQKLLQKLSPQQIQLMKLLQVPTASLEQRIKEELEENPALEEGSPDDIAEEETKEQNDEPENEEETNAEEKDDYSEEEVNEAIKEQDSFDIADYIEDDDVPYYKLTANNTSPDDERPETPVVVSISYQDALLSQLGL